MVLIGISGKARAGKDELAAYLIAKYSHKLDIRRYAFADVLKKELYDVLRNCRHDYWQTAGSENSARPASPPYCADSSGKLVWMRAHRTAVGRHMQLFGNYVRAIDSFHFIDALQERIEAEKPQVALLSDVRFLNEFYLVRASGGYLIKVTREGYVLSDGRDPTHISETALDNAKFDYEISVAEGALDELHSDAVTVFEQILQRVEPTTALMDDELVTNVAAGPQQMSFDFVRAA